MRKWTRYARDAGIAGVARVDLAHPSAKGLVVAYINAPTYIVNALKGTYPRPYGTTGLYDSTYNRRGKRYGPVMAGVSSGSRAGSRISSIFVESNDQIGATAGVFLASGGTTSRWKGIVCLNQEASWEMANMRENNGSTGGFYGYRLNSSNGSEWFGGDFGALTAGNAYFGVMTNRTGAQNLWLDGKKSGSPGTFSTLLRMTSASWAESASTSGNFVGPSYAWNRIPSDEEVTQLSENPWQLIRNTPSIFYSLPSIAPAKQYARPISDVAAGSWLPSSGSDLYAMIDEAG